ncbi:PEP-CTERM sorting domain-containing protein [Microcystis sp.]|uniref:PEP-CTERM sorting domain-containing protein n=1 Tax=Microcystis sp. TaxID=1127 RepID=UPI003AF4E1DD
MLTVNKLTQYTASSAMAIGVLASVFSSPSQAYELVFSSPNVISGINGVSLTLPSSGITRTYNITLEEGTIFDVYGNPPIFDLVTSIDAKAAMEESAVGLDFYLQNISADLSFLSPGIDIFYIPYEYDPTTETTSYWSSGKKFNNDGTPFIGVRQVDLPSDSILVYARLQAVPEPSSILSLLALGTLGAASTLKRKLKPSQSTEKETTKVS